VGCAVVRRGQEHACFGVEHPSTDLSSKVELADDVELCSAKKAAPHGARRRCTEGKMRRGHGVENARGRATVLCRGQGGCAAIDDADDGWWRMRRRQRVDDVGYNISDVLTKPGRITIETCIISLLQDRRCTTETCPYYY
jgi:hypothetical protein